MITGSKTSIIWNIFHSVKLHMSNFGSQIGSLSHKTATKTTMECNFEAHVRISNAEQFHLSFLYQTPESRENKQFNFSRNLSEPVGAFLTRLSMKINAAINTRRKKNSKKGHTVDNTTFLFVAVSLVKDGIAVSENVLLRDLFTDDHCNVVLQISDKKYTILKNYPWVQNLTLPKAIMAGYPVYPVKLELHYSNEEESEFLWHRVRQQGDDFISSGVMYVPSMEDIGHKLKLECVPKRNSIVGVKKEIISSCEVEAGPGLCPFEMRHAFTKSYLINDSFRVVSYNILADLYASSEAGKNELFNYCPPYALCMDYRKQLITRELLGYNADIICLQEVDCRMFDVDLKRCFKNVGFEAEFCKKGGQVSEGVACLFRKSRFKLILNEKLTLGEDSPKLSYLSHIWKAVEKNHLLYLKLKERTTCAQILLLEFIDKPTHKLIVANTHLYFHPNADNIRLLQAGICLGFVNNLLCRLKNENKDGKVSVLFCGDFNSTPECGVYKLFTTNYISDTYHEWKCGDDETENVTGFSLHNPIQFRSACGTPKFTNYTPLFSGCLDYIFYQSDFLNVEQVIPFPLEEDIVKHIAIPSVVFPSDHIALVADLKWK